MDRGGFYIAHQEGIRSAEERDKIASAIVSAVNNTYGAGVNPEAIPNMLNALKKVMEYFGDALYMDSPTPKIVAAAIEKSKL
jgi:uncharacterized protein (DUF1786 family)